MHLASGPNSLRVLLVTNMYPSSEDPARGIFVARQMRAVSALLGRPVDVVVVGKTGAGGLLRSKRAVAEMIRTVAPDVVHVHYGLSGAALPLTMGPPVVLTLCGSDVLRWKVWRDGKGLLEYAVSLATARRARAIVVQSDVMRDALPSGRLRTRVQIKSTGIDTTLFCPEDRLACRQRLGWDPRERVVLFGASPERILKRFDLATAACRALFDQTGTQVTLRALTGVSPDRVPTYLNAADCLLITSDWEAGPITFTEALACGIPIVTVEVGYAMEGAWSNPYVRVAARTPHALAMAMAELLSNPLPHRRPKDVVLPTEAGYAAWLADLYRHVA